MAGSQPESAKGELLRTTERSKCHDPAQKYMPTARRGVIAFGLNGTREEAIEFMDRLKFIWHQPMCRIASDLRTQHPPAIPPPAHRRTVSGSSSDLISSFSGHRECKRHHSRH